MIFLFQGLETPRHDHRLCTSKLMVGMDEDFEITVNLAKMIQEDASVAKLLLDNEDVDNQQISRKRG